MDYSEFPLLDFSPPNVTAILCDAQWKALYGTKTDKKEHSCIQHVLARRKGRGSDAD